MWDLNSVKAWLEITVDTTDAEIQMLMDRALDAVERELDWYFGASREISEILDGSGLRSLYLRQPPLNGVVVSERTTVGGTWAVVDAAEYELGGNGITAGRGMFNAGDWTRGVLNYRAVYDEGFTVMPGDIEQLLLDLVSAKWRNRGTEGLKSERIGDYAYTLGELEASDQWAKVVGRWRRGRI
jgi:hypothetical protein